MKNEIRDKFMGSSHLLMEQMAEWRTVGDRVKISRYLDLNGDESRRRPSS